MGDQVYAIMVDGPCAGLVIEVLNTARDIEVTSDGTHRYRRCRMHPSQVARIARYTYIGSLVV